MARPLSPGPRLWPQGHRAEADPRGLAVGGASSKLPPVAIQTRKYSQADIKPRQLFSRRLSTPPHHPSDIAKIPFSLSLFPPRLASIGSDEVLILCSCA